MCIIFFFFGNKFKQNRNFKFREKKKDDRENVLSVCEGVFLQTTTIVFSDAIIVI